MGVTTPIMDLNLSFIHDYRIGLISAPDILTRDISTRTFHHSFFLARVLFSSADILANENYVSKDIPVLARLFAESFRFLPYV